MDIAELKDKLIEKKKLFQDKLYKDKLMKKFGNACPRCSRLFIQFSIDKDCYKKFVTYNLSKKRSALSNKKLAKGKCVLCYDPTGNQKLFCSYCGNVK